MTHYDRLIHLSSEGQFFDSNYILTNLVAKQEWLIDRIESRRSALEVEGLLLRGLVASLDRYERAFAFRSGPILNLIDRLHRLGQKAELNQGEDFIKTHGELVSIFSTFANCRSELGASSLEPWREAGFDTIAPLSQPFPLVVSAWTTDFMHRSSWSESREIEKIFNTILRDLVAGGEVAALVDFPMDYIAQIKTALRQLDSISPRLLHDVVMNVRVMCHYNFAERMSHVQTINTSFSHKVIPGTLFLSPRAFDSSMSAMEVIYHEALHNKLANMTAVVPVFVEGYDGFAPALFTPEWDVSNETDKYWSYDRTLASFHVYVHLASLYAALLDEGTMLDIEKHWALMRFDTSIRKGKIIRGWLKQYNPKMLSALGQVFVQNLNEIFEASYS